jgi:hypothetical protein
MLIILGHARSVDVSILNHQHVLKSGIKLLKSLVGAGGRNLMVDVLSRTLPDIR